MGIHWNCILQSASLRKIAVLFLLPINPGVSSTSLSMQIALFCVFFFLFQLFMAKFQVLFLRVLRWL